MSKPEIDATECKLCEVCQELCPELFVMNPAGYLEVTDSDKYTPEEIQEAIALCPADCIMLVGGDE